MGGSQVLLKRAYELSIADLNCQGQFEKREHLQNRD